MIPWVPRLKMKCIGGSSIAKGQYLKNSNSLGSLLLLVTILLLSRKIGIVPSTMNSQIVMAAKRAMAMAGWGHTGLFLTTSNPLSWTLATPTLFEFVRILVRVLELSERQTNKDEYHKKGKTKGIIEGKCIIRRRE